ncbi:hypothetical protein Tco_0123732 [Tanacetum coccineum]
MPWRHQDSSVADPPPIGVRPEDIRRLCENVIDLRPVHPAMLYAIGLMTKWGSYVGAPTVFKRCKGTLLTKQCRNILKFPMADSPGRSFATSHNELPNDWKKKKIAPYVPLSFALSDSEADRSNRSGSDTHHSALPLNTIIPNEAELTTEGDGLILEYVNLMEEDTYHNLHNVEDTTEVNSPLSEHSPRSQHSNPSDEDTHDVRNEPTHTHASGSTCHGVNSSSSGSHRQAFSRRNHVATALVRSLLCSSLRGDMGLPDTKSAGGHCSNRNKLSDDHKALQQVHLGFVGKEADITKKLVAVEKERDDLLDKNREREERIKQLEANIASKTSSLTKAEGAVSTLKGDLERLTVDLSHAEIVRHNYVRQLLPTVFQRLLSSDEYKKECLAFRLMCVTWPLALGLIGA